MLFTYWCYGNILRVEKEGVANAPSIVTATRLDGQPCYLLNRVTLVGGAVISFLWLL